MKLADLRRLAIRQQSRIRFRLRNGMECVISVKGVAEVPDLKGIPDFNLEEELGAATAFLLEPSVPANRKDVPKPRSVSPAELAAMANAAPAPAGGHAEHEDD